MILTHLLMLLKMVNSFCTRSPDEDFGISDLSRNNLNAQLREAWQMLKIVESNDFSSNYGKHPATLMWKGYASGLKVYINICIDEWTSRVGKNGENYKTQYTKFKVKKPVYPWWCYWKDFHLSHKASLLRKDPDHYGKCFKLKSKEKKWLEYGYIWPSKLSKKIVSQAKEGKRFDPSLVCEASLGMGAPAHYRWTIEETKKWSKNKGRNPKTGRALTSTTKGSIYKDIEKAYKHYLKEGEIEESSSESSSSGSSETKSESNTSSEDSASALSEYSTSSESSSSD
jgi:hypothetical protein